MHTLLKLQLKKVYGKESILDLNFDNQDEKFKKIFKFSSRSLC